MNKPLIAAQVEEYLATRRAMGFALTGEGSQLRAFARVSQENQQTALTVESIMLWVQGASKPGPVTAARRVEVLRPFLKYCRQFDPQCPLIPVDYCGPAHHRPVPHIYTDEEVVVLLRAAEELQPEGLRPATYATLFGLLAVTGMRVSEALKLERKDMDLTGLSLTVRETKFKKSRLVPIHATTAEALSAYQQATIHARRQPGVDTVFLSPSGGPLASRTVHGTFAHLRRRLGWVSRGSLSQPRLHDLRHTFICKALLRGQQDQQCDRVADAIATYVGHVKVSDTYWYVSATSELMSEASQRFARFGAGGGR